MYRVRDAICNALHALLQGSGHSNKNSPRKSKKSDCCNQTETTSATQNLPQNALSQWKKYLHEHGLKNDPKTTGHAKVAIVSSVQSADAKSTHSTFSSKSSPNHRPVAVTRPSPSSSPHSFGPQKASTTERHHRSNFPSSGKPMAGQRYHSEIYSDSETVSGMKSYPFCLTSQVTAGARPFDNRERMSAIYGQVRAGNCIATWQP